VPFSIHCRDRRPPPNDWAREEIADLFDLPLTELVFRAYNHNIDTSPEHYGDIITTRTFQERLDTLEQVRNAGIAVCCGGIVGMGETREDRVGFIPRLRPCRAIAKACRSTRWCRSRARRLATCSTA
jgi:biotin synthase-like enzyme